VTRGPCPLDAASIDLVLTSWPYNARITYDGYADGLAWDSYWDGLIAPFLGEVFRVLRDGGRLALITQDLMQRDASQAPAHVGPFVTHYAEAAGFRPLRERLTWVRAPHGPVDPIWVFDKGGRREMPRDGAASDLSAAELQAWTRDSAWPITRGNADHVLGHSATFPLELPLRLIKLFSYRGESVLDPFMGAGTTLRAAKTLGRFGFGVEQSLRYCRLAASLCAQWPSATWSPPATGTARKAPAMPYSAPPTRMPTSTTSGLSPID
jgi:site-specific DNA-methyltransferase (adenine-specific)